MTRSSPGTVRIAADAARSAGWATPCALISGNVTASSIGTLGASSAVGAPFLLGDRSMRRAGAARPPVPTPPPAPLHALRRPAPPPADGGGGNTRAAPPDPAPDRDGGTQAGDEGRGADVPAVPREHGGQDGDPEDTAQLPDGIGGPRGDALLVGT